MIRRPTFAEMRAMHDQIANHIQKANGLITRYNALLDEAADNALACYERRPEAWQAGPNGCAYELWANSLLDGTLLELEEPEEFIKERPEHYCSL